MRLCNQAGINLIQSFEGLRTVGYLDQRGRVTIGYGHTNIYDGSLKVGTVWSVEKCNNEFLEDLEEFEVGVAGLVTQTITDNQFAALVSFSYNLGVSSLKNSTLLALVNEGDFNGAANQFSIWDHVGGNENPGLLRRRLAERTLFLTPDTGDSVTGATSTVS